MAWNDFLPVSRSEFNEKVHLIMTQISDLQAALDAQAPVLAALQVAVDKVQTDIAAAIATLQAEIAAAVAAGTVDVGPQTQAVTQTTNQLQSILTTLQSIDATTSVQ